MKRLLLIASVAILAAGCQKTFVDNEVQTPIGFSTEVGKQTRAIAQVSGNGSGSYFETQPFGVYAYGHQDQTNNENTIMSNVEITRQSKSTTVTNDDGSTTSTTTYDWKATGTTKYYWPNDPRTYINFYAYSPAHATTNHDPNNTLKNHQKLTGVISHSEAGGFTISGYQHTNMYVDFMVADPIMGATYSDQDGTGNKTDLSSVPLSFNHRMTQLIFKVKTNDTYTGVNFKLQSITLNNIKNTANITGGVFTNDASGSASFVVYPAKAESHANGAPGLETDQTVNLVIEPTVSELTEIIPVTMIPQAFDNNNQSFTVVYTIDGNGVATETVSKTFALVNTPAWGANKSITYTLSVGLNEITFAPSVADWTDTYDHDNDDTTDEISTDKNVNI